MGLNRIWAGQAAALVMAMALAGCGGGSGSGVVSTPAPTPTPTPASYTKISDMSGDRTFQTAGVQYITSQPNALSNGTSQALGSGVTVAYTASSDSYKLTAPDGTTTTFTPLDVAAPSPTAPNTQRWTKAGTGESFFLTVPTVNGVALSYTIVGSWQRPTAIPGQTDVRLAVGGVPTLASDMPRTGSATYSAAIGGSAAQSGAVYSLSGPSTASFTANFANNSVATSLMLAGTASVPFGAGTTSFGTFNGTGTISSSGPGFTGTLSGNGTTGIFSGAFFGPKALEMGYDWFLSGGTLSAAGTVTGVKQ
jgi:hypothetical protein